MCVGIPFILNVRLVDASAGVILYYYYLLYNTATCTQQQYYSLCTQELRSFEKRMHPRLRRSSLVTNFIVFCFSYYLVGRFLAWLHLVLLVLRHTIVSICGLSVSTSFVVASDTCHDVRACVLVSENTKSTTQTITSSHQDSIRVYRIYLILCQGRYYYHNLSNRGLIRIIPFYGVILYWGV